MTSAVQLRHDRTLTLPEISAVGRGTARISLAPETVALLAQRRAEVVQAVLAQEEPAYGFNRGFGHNVNLRVAGRPELLEELQLNLIRSHSLGVGEPAEPEVVRVAMVLRAQSLARGYSAVRPVVVETLLAALNADLVPVVPSHGSVSASGDLAPLSHMALALLGEGEVYLRGARVPAATALAEAGIAPLHLEMKEGLALNNGAQYLTALGLVAAERAMELLRTATIAASLSTQVMLGSSAPFREDLQALRPHPGALTVARWLRDLLHDSPIQRVHEDKRLDGEVQDPYNLRCAPQILGTCHDLIADAQRTFAIEAGSVTDNPLILRDGEGRHTDVVSGGHFHGMPVAVKVYNLVQAAAIMASLSSARCARYVDEQRNKGLGSGLVWPGLSPHERPTCSGLMIAEYTAASLTNFIWGQTTPSHLFNISTDAGQEDHVSMGAPMALRLFAILPRLAEVLALELAFAAQAAAIRKELDHFPSRAELPHHAKELQDRLVEELRQAVSAEEGRAVEVELSIRKLYPWRAEERLLSPAGEAVLARIAQVLPPVERDRTLAGEVAALAELVLRGEITAAAQTHAELT